MHQPIRRRAPLALASICAALLAACASVPSPLQREVVDLTPTQSHRSGRPGLEVRWGGRIVQTRPLANRTCFDMIGSALDRDGRPRDMTDDGSGRFIACREGFYDPAIFQPNREVTVVGRIEGFESQRIGESDYRQPVLAAEAVYLWPKALPVDSRYPAPRPWPWLGWDWDPRW